jgi:type IV pilus assembly protein PilO
MTTHTMESSAKNVTRASVEERIRGWLTPLNLHFAGVGLLVLVNVYLLVHMGLAWEAKHSRNAEAMAEQQVRLKAAEIAAKPLEGLDAKLATATGGADEFYAKRLPGSVSQVAAERGELAKKLGVKETRVQYVYAPVLAGSKGELTEVKMDASLTGDYRALVQFINALERDKTFFVINGISLSGQQSGTVNLRLRLTTYLRGPVPEDEKTPGDVDSDDAGDAGKKSGTTAGPVGAARAGAKP